MDEDRVTRLLHQWAEGDDESLDLALSLLYELLRKKIRVAEKGRVDGHSRSPTQFLHDAYDKLSKITRSRRPEFQSRCGFIAYLAQAARNQVTDYLRQKQTVAYGGDLKRVDIERVYDTLSAPTTAIEDRIALNEAIDRLHEIDPRKAQMFDMKFVWGMSSVEIAAEFELTREAVDYNLRRARFFLQGELAGRKDGSQEDSDD